VNPVKAALREALVRAGRKLTLRSREEEALASGRVRYLKPEEVPGHCPPRTAPGKPLVNYGDRVLLRGDRVS